MAEGFQIFGFHAPPIIIDIYLITSIVIVLAIIRIIYGTTKASKLLPESSLIIIVGLIFGVIFHFASDPLCEKLTFTEETFLYILVPIIIYEASVFINRSVFAHNFLEIMVYAIFGTLINVAITGILLYVTNPIFVNKYTVSQVFSFSSLISAVDPVAVMAIFESLHVNSALYNLTFGESVLNDGVSVVLFTLFKSLDSIDGGVGMIIGLGVAKFIVSMVGAVLVGAIVSLLFCFIFKYSYRKPIVEPILAVALGYFIYALADSLLFSGIIAIIVTGVIVSKFATGNFSKNSAITFNNTLKMLSSTAESTIFLAMALQMAFILCSLPDGRHGKIDWVFAIFTVLYTYISRIITTFFLTSLLNLKRKRSGDAVSVRETFVLAHAGLRGAIAFALSIALPEEWDMGVKYSLILATIVEIIVSVFVYGGTMRRLLIKLKIRLEKPVEKITQYNIEEGRARLANITLLRPLDHLAKAIKTLAGYDQTASRAMFKADKLMQKIFLRKLLPQEQQILEIFKRTRILEQNQNMSEHDRLVLQHLKERTENLLEADPAMAETASKMRIELEEKRLFEEDMDEAIPLQPNFSIDGASNMRTSAGLASETCVVDRDGVTIDGKYIPIEILEQYAIDVMDNSSVISLNKLADTEIGTVETIPTIEETTTEKPQYTIIKRGQPGGKIEIELQNIKTMQRKIITSEGLKKACLLVEPISNRNLLANKSLLGSGDFAEPIYYNNNNGKIKQKNMKKDYKRFSPRGSDSESLLGKRQLHISHSRLSNFRYDNENSDDASDALSRNKENDVEVGITIANSNGYKGNFVKSTNKHKRKSKGFIDLNKSPNISLDYRKSLEGYPHEENRLSYVPDDVIAFEDQLQAIEEQTALIEQHAMTMNDNVYFHIPIPLGKENEYTRAQQDIILTQALQNRFNRSQRASIDSMRFSGSYIPGQMVANYQQSLSVSDINQNMLNPSSISASVSKSLTLPKGQDDLSKAMVTIDTTNNNNDNFVSSLSNRNISDSVLPTMNNISVTNTELNHQTNDPSSKDFMMRLSFEHTIQNPNEISRSTIAHEHDGHEFANNSNEASNTNSVSTSKADLLGNYELVNNIRKSIVPQSKNLYEQLKSEAQDQNVPIKAEILRNVTSVNTNQDIHDEILNFMNENDDDVEY